MSVTVHPSGTGGRLSLVIAIGCAQDGPMAMMGGMWTGASRFDLMHESERPVPTRHVHDYMFMDRQKNGKLSASHHKQPDAVVNGGYHTYAVVRQIGARSALVATSPIATAFKLASVATILAE